MKISIRNTENYTHTHTHTHKHRQTYMQRSRGSVEMTFSGRL